MRALSSLALVALVALGGCDFVFGLTDQPEPCELASFATADETAIVEVDAFSVDWDQTFAIVEHRGLLHELTLPAGQLTPIEVDPYNHVALALTPEGDALLYTIAVEPFELKGALRTADAWQLDAAVPPGLFAGTPSADAFGPRRVLVRTSPTEDVQEFVDDNGRWMPIGAPLRVPGAVSPNLTPNGLTIVFATTDAAGVAGVFAASRDDVDSAFGEPVLLRTGDYRVPQLCGRCRQLYAIDNGTLVRFDQ
jgi:hypothetical protein